TQRPNSSAIRRSRLVARRRASRSVVSSPASEDEKMKKEVVKNIPIVTAKDASGQPVAPLSLAIKAGEFVFVAGMTQIDPSKGKMVVGDIETQTRRVLDNGKFVLETAGSSLDRVVKATVYCTNAGYFDRVNVVYRQCFPVEPPTRTFVNVGSWPH